ncbi:prepilin peptidase [Christensenellaceae bacterium OttesenSCG-928-L17]|nr:prepilin peptidase [Christensenellaceae bacterium OttesenSCG-928-L17]
MYYLAWGLILLLMFLLGSVVFSFLNVVAYRLPRGENPFRGRSHCTACNHMLAAGDLIPIVSYLSLKGRCRYCGEKVSPRYLLVELAGGLICVLCTLVVGLPLSLFYFAVAAVLSGVAIADWDTQEIPDQFNIALAILGVASIWLLPEVTFLERVIGVFVVSVPLLLLAMFLGAFGGGDVKLMAAAGLLLGWKLTLLAAFIGILVGGVYAVVLLAKKKAGGKTAIAFGPYLSIGIFVAMLWGSEILGWYLTKF